MDLIEFYVEEVNGESIDIKDESSVCVYAKPEDRDKLYMLGIKVGRKYEQDTILFVEADGQAKFVATRKDNFLGLPVGEKKKLGSFKTQNLGKYFTLIGKKKFSFSEIKEEFTPVNSFFRDSIAKMFLHTMNEHEDWGSEWISHGRVDGIIKYSPRERG